MREREGVATLTPSQRRGRVRGVVAALTPGPIPNRAQRRAADRNRRRETKRGTPT